MKTLPIVFFLVLASVTFTDAETKIGLDDTTGRIVDTAIPGSFTSPEGVVAALFSLSDQASNKNLKVPFTKDQPPGARAKRDLIAFYRGARWDGTTIIVSFDGGAMDYLNNSASFQQSVKGSIERSLKLNFPKMTKVAYEVDGKIVEGWDA